MPQVFGNIATVPERLISGKGNPYVKFRLAEHHGKDEKRRTQWYDVLAFNIPEIDADLLYKGQFVKVSGILEVAAYSKRDGTPGASLTLTTFEVEPIATKQSQQQPATA